MEEKSMRRFNTHDKAYAYRAYGTDRQPYDTMYADALVVLPVPPTNGANVALDVPDDRRDFLLIPWCEMRKNNFVTDVDGYVCGCCGEINPTHTSNVVGSGNAVPTASFIQLSVDNQSAVPRLAARDPIGFVEDAPLPYGATVRPGVLTVYPASRWVMEHFVRLDGIDEDWTQERVDVVVHAFGDALQNVT
jgi:hypothetical protein